MTKFEKWCSENGFDKDGVFTVIMSNDMGFPTGVEVKLYGDDGSSNPSFKSVCGGVALMGDSEYFITFKQKLTQYKTDKTMTTKFIAGDKIKFNESAVSLKSYDSTAAGVVINPSVSNGIISAEWKRENGEVFYTTSLSEYRVDKQVESEIVSDKDKLKPGDTVRFSDAAIGLKSYCYDATGEIIRVAIYGGVEEKGSWCVKFKYIDGRELTIPVISERNLDLVNIEEQIAKLESEREKLLTKRNQILSHLSDVEADIKEVEFRVNDLKAKNK